MPAQDDIALNVLKIRNYESGDGILLAVDDARLDCVVDLAPGDGHRPGAQIGDDFHVQGGRPWS